MPTAQDIVTAALREIMIVRTGQTPASTELADGLAKLNRMLASWNTERLVVYAMSRFTGALVSGTQSYTIGASGATFTATRPISIHSANILSASGGVSLPLRLIDEIEFAAVPGRTRQQKAPLKLWYQAIYPNGVLWFWPVPNTACTVELFSWVQLAQLATLGATFDFPPGYEQAIVLNLAVQLASQFERQPTAELIRDAAQAKAAITGVNAPPFAGAAEEVQASNAAVPGAPQAAAPTQQ